MANRNILAASRLDAFKTWLDKHGIEHRPSGGAYQVMQLQLPGDPRWHAIYHRSGVVVHLSVPRPLEQLVRDFVKGEMPQQATTQLHGAESFTPMSRHDYDNLKQTAEHASDDVPWE